MNAFLEKAFLIVAMGMVGIFILAGSMQYKKMEALSLPPHFPVYSGESNTGSKFTQISGAEGEVPQKLIEELNSKGNDNEEH